MFGFVCIKGYDEMDLDNENIHYRKVGSQWNMLFLA